LTRWAQRGFKEEKEREKEKFLNIDQKKFRKTSETIEGFCSVISVTGLSGSRTGIARDDTPRISMLNNLYSSYRIMKEFNNELVGNKCLPSRRV
jgi:hypothetical protein